MLKIEQVEQLLINKREEGHLKDDLAIYMTFDFWGKCIAEIHGCVSSVAIEFKDNGTVRGIPVYRYTDVPRFRPCIIEETLQNCHIVKVLA